MRALFTAASSFLRGAPHRAPLFLVLLAAWWLPLDASPACLECYARAPLFEMPALSPDGDRLLFVRQRGERQCVQIQKLPGSSAACVLELMSARERVRWCGWSGALTAICGTVKPVRSGGYFAEQSQLYAIDSRSGKARLLDVAAADGVRDKVIDLMPDQDSEILVQHDPIGSGYPKVSALNVHTRRVRTAVEARKPVRQWLTAGRGRILLGMGYEQGTASVHIREPSSQSWQVMHEHPLGDVRTLAPLAFGPNAAVIYALGNHQGRAALFEVDARSPYDRRLLFHHPLYDVAGPIILGAEDRRVIGTVYLAGRETTMLFEEHARRRQAWLDEALPGKVNLLIDQSRDGQRHLVRSYSDVDPPSWYLLDDRQQALALIGHQFPELETTPLAPMESTRYRARDGQVIPAYLTRPPGPATGTGPMPAVVLPHGGPESRDRWGFDPMVQWLASEGFAVLQMNFRGSTGYGAAFHAAGLGQWGGVIHNDITDGVRWLVEQKIADPSRICIVGRSFGGYAAMLGAARESQWYACAASFAGVGDLLAYSQYTQRLAEPDMWRIRLGSDARGLWQMSPIARIAFTETAVLLVHGRSDPVVPVTQSRRLARALKQAGRQHRYVERTDCDHDMTIESCRLDVFAELRALLSGIKNAGS